MTPERWKQIENLYHEALALTQSQRSAFLDQSCASDEELRREIESLLASHEQVGTFIDKPPDDVVAGMLAEEQAVSILGRTLGHYKLQSLLGAGGMGEVYRARDSRLDRDVAVKILSEQLAQDPEALRRFEREAKAVAALSHPNILAIFDFGTEDGVCYAVMELLKGETLRECVKRGPLAWPKAIEIGNAIAEGLAAAHDQGIIHRDLKPENIFLTSDGGVKILDFGLARMKRLVLPDAETVTMGIETTKQGVVMGTIGYMSPEQVKGSQADAPSDIFSLGCVLYETLSGQRPFTGETATETLAAILRDEPAPLSTSGNKVPEALERMIRHCLEKQPANRYQSARDLAFELKAMLTGRSIAASMPTRRPMRPAMWLGSAAVIALLVIAAWLIWGGGRERAIDSLAILPMVNASGDTNLEYLSDGITDSLINTLSQLPQLRVMARSTVFTYKSKEVDPRKVGQELNVRAVFTGKIVQRGDTLNIQADLVNATDGSQLWGERYNRRLSDLLTIQEEITRHISERLRLKLSGREQQRLAKRQTTNIEAHQLYLKGRYQWDKSTKEGLNKALGYFQQAIELDPDYALAYVGIADVYVQMANDYLPSQETITRAGAAARKALELDETLAEAHTALAFVKFQYDWEWGEAERAFKRAFELNPGYAYAHNQYGIFLVMMGRFAEAKMEMDRAHEQDPLSPWIHVGTVWPVYFARQYDQAIEQLRRIVALNPDFSNAHLNLGWAYAQKEMYEEAIAALRKARSLDDKWMVLASLGYTYAKSGRREEAQQVLVELQKRAKREHVSEYGLATVYAGLGERDRALAALERGYQMRDAYLTQLKVEPFFDNLRSDARFADLLRRMNLSP